MLSDRAQRGQASVELVAAIPALLLITLVAAQLAVVGYSLWSAGTAARAGARATYVGGEAKAAARSALPGPLRQRARISAGDAVRVRIAAPSLLPWFPGIPVAAVADLGAGRADGG
jgi:hypothetical protein